MVPTLQEILPFLMIVHDSRHHAGDAWSLGAEEQQGRGFRKASKASESILALPESTADNDLLLRMTIFYLNGREF